MKLSLKRIAVLCSAVSLTAVAATAQAAGSCTPAHKFSTIKPGTLSVATWEFPPYSIPVSPSEVNGVDGDILRLIAAKECLTLSFANVDAAAVIQSVVSGKADIGMGDWYRTADRAKVLGLSAPMYLDQMGVISGQGNATIASMQGKRVGAVAGYLWTSDLQKVFGSSLTIYPNPVAMAQDLAAGRIDIGTDSYAVAVYDQKKGGYKAMKIDVVKPDQRVPASIQPGQTAFPFTKTNQALGDALSADIEALHQSGDISRILKAHGLDPNAANVGTPRLVQ
ncbi:substrate-binding periplasmic protein [Paraburkholderia phosphatilytica]|uniref:substrate-binding periplasmic protein n=1 Tax=Paraburkholderia phosphatilytica TaxID=2282883 RepID=UPI000E539FF6|nr:transporter substrate-binding domain-containing protein [Paraburkholderia phosphatilytica]